MWTWCDKSSEKNDLIQQGGWEGEGGEVNKLPGRLVWLGPRVHGVSDTGQRWLFIRVHTVLSIAKQQKQPKCLSIGEWISTLWCIHTMEYDPAEKEWLLTTALIIWVNITTIKQNGISRHKDILNDSISIKLENINNPLESLGKGQKAWVRGIIKGPKETSGRW